MIRRTDNRRRARSLQLLLMGSFCFAINTSIAAPVGGNVMDVSTGVRTGTGSVIELPGGNPTQMRIDLIADPGVSVTIALPNSIPVIGTNYGSVLTWLPTLNTPAIFNMPPSGTFILNLAGELTIPPGFIADVFAGTVTISIEYSF
jgi:hypothetical protein